MTQHLSPDELIEVVEDRTRLLAAGRAAHLSSCRSCRQQVQELRSVMLEASDLTVPEPSPLFWEHAAKRLSDVVATDLRSRQRGWWERLRLSHMTTAVTTASVVLAVVLGLPFLRAPSDRQAIGAGDSVDGAAERTIAAGLADDVSADEPADWALLLAVADAVEWADSETDLFMVDREALITAVFELTSDEQQALVQLLEAELEGSL